MRNIVVYFLVSLSTIAWLGRATFAEPPQSGDAPASKSARVGKQPKPEDLLRKMADYLGNLPAFSCRIESTLEIKANGTDRKRTMIMSARLVRPNRVTLVVDEREVGMTIKSDGKQLVQYVPSLKRYMVSDAPANLADFGKPGGPVALSMIGGVPPLPTGGDDFYKELTSGVTKSEYLGTEKVGNVQCHHCRFSQEAFDWDIWIETGDKPLIRKVSPDFSKRFAEAGGALADAKMSYVIVVSDWNTAPKFTSADFSFTPPADAEKVDDLFEGLSGGEDEGPHPLLGQPAPDFETVDLNEHPIVLKTYLGKNVILLDFWATWCGPCVAAMPKIDEVAKKFADKGLVFRAVDVGEDAATIKEFLESNKLDPPVALDTKNEIGPAYKVNGIPQTVLIGKDGKVQVVHIGYSDNLPDMLSKEIEDLLAGKDLAGQELKKAGEARKKKAEREAAKPKAAPESKDDADKSGTIEKVE
jgi:peroxiredoxin